MRWIEITVVFVVCLVIYGLMTGEKWFEQSLAPHYVHLADAFLEGRVDIADTGNVFDLTTDEDGERLFVTSPPLPALVLMPIVTFFNEQFSDTLFSVIWGAVTVAAVHGLFRKWWLTILFGFGTPFLLFSGLGSVWFQAQAVAILFAILGIWLVDRGRIGWGGLMWGIAVLGRPTLVLGAPLLIFLAHTKARRREGENKLSHAKVQRRKDGEEDRTKARSLKITKEEVKRFIIFLVPVGVSVVGLMGYNFVRFGDVFDFGYAAMLGADNLVAAIEQFGTFHWRFLPCNLWVSLGAPPIIGNRVPEVAVQACGHLFPADYQPNGAFVQPNPAGMSLFLVTPAFLLLFWAKRTWRNGLLWLGILVMMIPNWFLHNTGSTQFGYRYFMDCAPFWVLLMDDVLGQKRLRVVGVVLVCVSVVIHFWGYDWLYGLFVGGNWWDAWL